MTTAHGSLPKNPLASAPLGTVRLLGREGLSHELHRVRNLAGVIHLQLDIAVAPEPEIGDVGGKPAWVGDLVEAHVEGEQKPALLRHDVREVRVRLVGDIVPRELFADRRRQAEDLLPDRLEEVVHRRTGTQMRVIRLLMLTGCRLNEIQTLRWEDVNLEAAEIRLRDGKTGARMVPLSGAAVSVLSALPRPEDNPWVIVGRKPGAHLTDLQHPWRRIRARADLDDVRIHDLRHSFASRALALGESLPMIGKLLGHTQVQTTARYAHLANESVKASGSRVGDSIGAHIAPSEPA